MRKEAGSHLSNVLDNLVGEGLSLEKVDKVVTYEKRRKTKQVSGRDSCAREGGGGKGARLSQGS